MKKDLNYYLSLDYPIECYGGEHEIGDAFLACYIDFEIKASSEDYNEAISIAREYLIKHIKRELEMGHELPEPNEGIRFKEHREALQAYNEKNYTKAFEIWSKEVSYKNDQAMTNLGLLYLKGEGVDKDYNKAREWFEKASEYDNDSANFNLGQMYQAKIGVEEDDEKAIHYFRKAVQKGHKQANLRLALLLLKNRSNVENVKEGFGAMITAANGGNMMAKMQIAGLDRQLPVAAQMNENFRSQPLEKQLYTLNDALDRYIRPILQKDGGDIFLIDYKLEPHLEIRLAYQGNCAGCSMAATSTYDMIKNIVTNIIDENVKLLIL
jgi:uncharacterized protein